MKLRCCGVAAIVGVAVGLLLPAVVASAWTLEHIVERTPLEDSQLPALRNGEVVATPIVEAGKRELAIALACLVRPDAGDLLQPFLRDHPMLPAEHIVETGEIQSKTDWQALDRSTLALEDAAELARYLKASPGFTINLSSEELAEFSGIGGEKTPDRVGAVRHAIHRMLQERYREYRERGVAGIAEYVRGPKDTVDPGKLLARSLDASPGLAAFLPAFELAWRDYPKTDFEPVDDTFFWASLEVDDRPTWLLAHRYAGSQVVAQRTFYVSHFFDAGSTVVGWLEAPEGRVFFYVNRLWLDRLSGLGSSIKRMLGRRLLTNLMKERIGQIDVCRSEP